jgi:hypothetical protein
MPVADPDTGLELWEAGMNGDLKFLSFTGFFIQDLPCAWLFWVVKA